MKFLLPVLMLILAFPAIAEEEPLPTFSGEISFELENQNFTLKDLPAFEDYPAEAPPVKTAADIEFKSFDGAWSFRTRLRNGLKEGPNFNGHYVVVRHGCGASCQGNWVVDIETGRVVGNFTTSQGSAFRPDSALIIANHMDRVTQDDAYMQDIVFYRVEKGKLETLRTLNIREESQKQWEKTP